jgi:hypothetical protein
MPTLYFSCVKQNGTAAWLITRPVAWLGWMKMAVQLRSITLRTAALIAISVLCLLGATGAAPMTQGEQMYRGLRDLALTRSPRDLSLQLDQTKVTAYGVLMEMGLDRATVTLTSFGSGDASLYFSTGGGILGGIGHETVRNAVQQFVRAGHTVLGKMRKVTEFPLPEAGGAHFYVLTNQGVYASPKLLLRDLENSRSEFSPLFFAGNDVISEIRMTQPNTR